MQPLTLCFHVLVPAAHSDPTHENRHRRFPRRSRFPASPVLPCSRLTPHTLQHGKAKQDFGLILKLWVRRSHAPSLLIQNKAVEPRARDGTSALPLRRHAREKSRYARTGSILPALRRRGRRLSQSPLLCRRSLRPSTSIPILAALTP